MGVYPSNRRLNRNRRLNPNSFFFFSFFFIFYYLSVLSSSPSSTKKLSLPTAVFLLNVKMKKFTLIMMLVVTFSLTQICVGCVVTTCTNNKCVGNGRRQHQVAEMGDKSTPTTPPIILKKK